MRDILEKKLTGLVPIAVAMIASVSLAADPGVLLPSDAGVNDQKPGSILFYNVVTSKNAAPFDEDTQLSITNTSTTTGIDVIFHFVNGASGILEASRSLSLTPNGTMVITALEQVPGLRGFAIALAVNANACPLAHNFLIGNASVKLSSAHVARLSASAIAARFAGSVPSCDATLRFDGTSTGYDRIPRRLALTGIGSRVDGNEALLIMNRFGGSLNGTNGMAPIGSISGQLISQSGSVHNFSASIGSCQFRSVLSNTFPSTVPEFEAVVSTGQRGWLTVEGESDVGLFGAVINLDSSVSTSKPKFSGGQNLQLLAPASVSLVIPIVRPF